MKKIAFLLILFSLTACAAPAPAATPIPAFTFAPASPTPEPATATLAPTATAIPTETPTPEVKQFKTCQIEKFRDCPIPVDDLFNGNYLRWLKTRSKPFDPAKLKWLPPQLIVDAPGLPYIGYNTKTAPNYRDESTAPFRRLVTSGVVTYQGMDYLVIPIEFADPQAPGNPQKNVWTIGVVGFLINSRDQLVASAWKNQMHIAPIVTSDKDWSNRQPIPLVAKSFAEDPQMAERFKSFVAGQVSALDGKVVQLEIGIATDHSLE